MLVLRRVADRPGQALGELVSGVLGGEGQLVYGSDRPVVAPDAPQLDAELGRVLLSTNPHRLLTPEREGALA